MKRGFPVEFMCPFANSYTLASSNSINMAKITIAKMGTKIHAKWPASLAGFHPDHLHTDWGSEVCATWQDKTTWIGCLWSEDWGFETGLRYTCIVSDCIRIYTNLKLILIIPSISKQFRDHPSMEGILCGPCVVQSKSAFIIHRSWLGMLMVKVYPVHSVNLLFHLSPSFFLCCL